MDASEVRQTRGFLFADLRDYSRFTERFGDDAAAKLLARYRAVVRDAIARFEGAEIRTEGDSFYVVFTSVGSAVRAGLAILDDAGAADGPADAAPIRVGIGIHAGETVDTDEGIVSSAVNIAARVCSAAGPGQLLVTETVRGLTRAICPFASWLSDHGDSRASPSRWRCFGWRRARAFPRHHRLPRRSLVLAGGVIAAAVVFLGMGAFAGLFNGMLVAGGPSPPAEAASPFVPGVRS